MRLPEPDIFNPKALAYHKLSKDIIVFREPDNMWLSEVVLELAEELKNSTDVERTWLYNSSILINSVDTFGQKRTASALGVSQSIISQRYRTCTVVMEIIGELI